MFDDLIHENITVLLKDESSGHNKQIDIPNLQAVLSVQEIWEMCQWIYDEFSSDIQEIELSHLPAHLLDDEMVRRRNISRTISYVIHINLLEGILNRLYTETCKEIEKYLGEELKNRKDQKKRRGEMEQALKFRNKVAAHTAYADPKEEDNISDQLSSLGIFSSFNFIGNNPLGFHLGSISHESNGIKPNHDLKIGLHSLHAKMIKHFQEWGEMFIELLNKSDAFLPISNKSIELSELSPKIYKLSAEKS